MNKWKTIASTVALTTMIATPAMADTTISYNNVLLHTTQPVQNIDGRTMVAMRDLFENLDAQVSWNESLREATLEYRDMKLKMYPDAGTVLLNNQPQALDVRPQLINDRVYLPLRFVAQSLGGTVDYVQLPNGDGKIDIHTMNSEENYIIKDGKVIRVVREAIGTALQQSYFFDSHGDLVELQNINGKIIVNKTDYRNHNFSVQELDAPAAGITFGDVSNTTDATQVILKTAENPQYVGVGSPIERPATAIVQSIKRERLCFFESAKQDYVLALGNPDKTPVTYAKNVSGLVLNLDDYDFTTALSVKTPKGNQAFLLDDYMLVVDKTGKTLQETVIPTTVKDAMLFTQGEHILLLYVDAGADFPDAYVLQYDEMIPDQLYGQNISKLTEIPADETFYSYHKLAIKDAMLKGTTLYAFLKTDMDYYVVTYDYATGKTTKEKLGIKERQYDRFIDTLDDVKLLATDNNYYYLRDIAE